MCFISVCFLFCFCRFFILTGGGHVASRLNGYGIGIGFAAPDPSGLDKAQKVGVESFLMGVGQSMRPARINYQFAVLEQLR